VAIRSCRVITPPRRMGRGGATVSLLIGQDSRRLRCVGFNMGELADRLIGVNTVDVVGQPVLNRFGRRTSAEMHLRDVVWG